MSHLPTYSKCNVCGGWIPIKYTKLGKVRKYQECTQCEEKFDRDRLVLHMADRDAQEVLVNELMNETSISTDDDVLDVWD